MDQGKDLEVFFVVSKIEPEAEVASDDESDQEETDECNQESKQQIVLDKLRKDGFIHEEDIEHRFHGISAWRVAKWEARAKKGANCDDSGHDDYMKGFEHFMNCLENFCKARLQALIEEVSSVLIKVQSRCLDFFLEAADTLHKDTKAIMEVLKKAKQEEETVHTRIVSDLDRRKEDITDVISSTIEEARAEVLQEARTFKYDLTKLSELISRDGTVSDQAAVDECRAQIHSMVTNKLEAKIKLKFMQMFSTRDQFFSHLQKRIRDLEKEILTDAEAPFFAARALTQSLSTSYNVILKLKKPTEGFFKRFLRIFSDIFAVVFGGNVPVGRPEWRAEVASKALDGVYPQEVSQNLIDSLRDYFIECHETFQKEVKKIISLFEKGKTVKDHQRKKIRELAPDIAMLEMRAYSVSDQQKFGTPRKGELLGKGGQGCVHDCPNITTPDGKACVVKTFCLSKDEQLKNLSLELHTTRYNVCHFAAAVE